MKILKVVQVIAVISLALSAGVYFDTFASGSARAAMSPASFIQYQQVVHSYYGKMMPALLIVSLLTALIWLLMMQSGRRSAEFWLIAASIGGILFVAAITRMVNVPLNNQLMSWSAEAPPANLREVWAPWERVNAIRAAVSVGAFALQTLALAWKSAPKAV